MRVFRQLCGLTLAMLTGAYAFAQGQPNFIRGSVSLEGKYVMLPPGTTFEGRIDQTIGSSVSHAGEGFAVTLSAPVLLNGADVVIPAGSQVLGEVVEAVPSSKLPHHKDEPVPNGILRVQLTSLKTAEGATFPLVASLTYDRDKGSGVAYVGSPESFAPKNKPGRGGNSPSAGQPLDSSASRHSTDLTRAQAIPWQNMGNGAADLNYNSFGFSPQNNSNQQGGSGANDANNQNPDGQGGNLYNGSRNVSDRTRAGAYAVGRNGNVADGNDPSGNNAGSNKHHKQSSGIESLVRRNHNLFIDSGSPLTMKLNAPLKIGFNPPAAPSGEAGSSNVAQPSMPVIPSSAGEPPANNNLHGVSKPDNSSTPIQKALDSQF